MGSCLMDFLQECEDKYQDVPAFVYRDGKEVREVSFQEFLTDVKNRQMYFEDLTEERIGLWAFNSYDWIVSAVALLLAKKTVILLDGNLNQGQIIQMCLYTDVGLLAADDEMMEEKEDLSPYFPMISIMDAACEKAGAQMGIPHIAGEEAVGQDGEEGAFICFTSGTSQSAKGVVITAQSLCGCVKAYKELAIGKPGKKYYLPLPYHHIYPFTYIFRILYYGGTHCIGQMGRYLMEDFEVMKPETMFCVPSILRYLLEKEFFPEQLKAVFTAGSCLRPELGAKIIERGIELYNLYGSSESIGIIGSTTIEGGIECFYPASGVRFISAEDGELGVVLPYYMKEYYQKPEDTRKVIDKNSDLLWMGDSCEIGPDGTVKIQGRIRDMIVLENGEKIHAEDTDRELSALPGVKEAAVIGADGELVAVFLSGSAQQDEAIVKELKRYNRGRSPFVRIGKIWFRKEEFPKTAIGKLKRAVLEKEYRAGFGKKL